MKKLSVFLALLLLLSLIPPSYADFPHSTLDPSSIPAYSQDSDYYIELNDGVPDFEIWQHTTFSFVLFSPLDTLGRTGPAYACLGPETLPTDVRGPMPNVTSSGWVSTQYEGIGSLYNRSHLIGYLLCGDDGTPENLITGTELMNQGTMFFVESAVEDYIQSTGNHVLYRVTPFYHGDDLVPFGVQIEALSMERDQEGISLNLFLYNIEPGIVIDYATGESWEEGRVQSIEAPADEVGDAIRTIPAEEVIATPEPEKIEATYVLNKNTYKFHYPWTNDDRMMITCCNDGTRPVIFKIERIDIPENDEEAEWLEKQSFKNSAENAYTG